MMVLKRISERVNPYVKKLFDYPDRIIPFFEMESDSDKFKTLLKDCESEVFLEYGSGSGSHLLNLAKLHPNILCIGFEIRFKRAVRTIEKGNEQKISNVLIARTRGELAQELVPQDRISGIFINFPDPWEKKRWLKHRILTKNRIEEFLKLLKPGGFISIKTDHLSYFNDFMAEINGSEKIGKDYKLLLETRDLPRETQKFNSNLDQGFAVSSVETEFEKLFRGQNKKICYCLISKT